MTNSEKRMYAILILESLEGVCDDDYPDTINDTIVEIAEEYELSDDDTDELAETWDDCLEVSRR